MLDSIVRHEMSVRVCQWSVCPQDGYEILRTSAGILPKLIKNLPPIN